MLSVFSVGVATGAAVFLISPLRATTAHAPTISGTGHAIQPGDSAEEQAVLAPIAQMFEITLRQSFTIAARGSHRARALLEHRAVLDCIAARDAEGAREATAILLNQAAGDLVKIRGRDFAKRPRNAKLKAGATTRRRKKVAKPNLV